MRKQFAVLLFLALFASTLVASTPDRWIQIRTDHFLVITNSSERDARHTAGQFERMRAVFKTLLPTAVGKDNAVITVLALKSQKDFQSIEPAPYLAKNQLTLDGLFLRTQDKNYILVRLDDQDERAHPYATVYHEYTHFLNKNDEWLPLWLNEGLAEFYQNTDIMDKEVMLGQASPEDIFYLRENKLVPLATLLAVDHSSPYYHDEQKGSVFYAESWALTHYLIVNDRVNKTNLLGAYVKNLIAGQDPVTAATAAFGDLKKLQRDLDNYVGQGSFSRFKMDRAFPVDEAAFKVESLPTTDANTVRAAVLLADDRKPEAIALLDSVLGQDPKNAAAHEVMGEIKYREGDIQAARKWYDEAVQLDSHSYLAQFYSAQFALHDNGDPATIESRLDTCIKLNPAFAPAYDAKAQLYASHHEKLDEAHMLNVMAVQLDPGNIGFRLNTAMVLMEEQQPDNALSVLRAAEKVAKPTEVGIIQGRIREIESYQARLKAAPTPAPESSMYGLETVEVTTTTQPGGKSPDGKTLTTDHGHLVLEAGTSAEPHFPAQANGPQHTVKGVITNVKCYYPSSMVLSLEQNPKGSPGKTLHLFVNDYFKVDFYTMNFEPKGDLKPCTEIEGLKASIDYKEVNASESQNVDGKILKVELTK